jgi:hypothetical protein
MAITSVPLAAGATVAAGSAGAVASTEGAVAASTAVAGSDAWVAAAGLQPAKLAKSMVASMVNEKIRTSFMIFSSGIDWIVVAKRQVQLRQ